MFVFCPLNLTFDYVNLKLTNDQVQTHSSLPLKALKNGGAPVICRRRRRIQNLGGGGAAGAM